MILAYALLSLAAWLVAALAVAVVFGLMCRLGSSRCVDRQRKEGS